MHLLRGGQRITLPQGLLPEQAGVKRVPQPGHLDHRQGVNLHPAIAEAAQAVPANQVLQRAAIRAKIREEDKLICSFILLYKVINKRKLNNKEGLSQKSLFIFLPLNPLKGTY
jgi:hypothetical protein